MDFPERKIHPNEMIISFPDEEWFACPFNSKHTIAWSEYEAHIWCYDCQKDYPSCFCKDNFEESLDIFYKSIKKITWN